VVDREVLPSSNVVTGLNRAGLYRRFAEAGAARGAEIGVWYGVNAKVILDNVPGLRLYLVDPYKEYQAGRSHYSQEMLDLAFKRAIRRLHGQNIKFFRLTSLEASRRIPDEILDFVYIDGNHSFKDVLLDLLLWVPKVKIGGFISGHDYFNRRARGNVGVKAAVDAYTSYYDISFLLTDKLAEKHGPNATPSWFWRKQ
jgi:hypothetical protein